MGAKLPLDLNSQLSVRRGEINLEAGPGEKRTSEALWSTFVVTREFANNCSTRAPKSDSLVAGGKY